MRFRFVRICALNGNLSGHTVHLSFAPTFFGYFRRAKDRYDMPRCSQFAHVSLMVIQGEHNDVCAKSRCYLAMLGRFVKAIA